MLDDGEIVRQQVFLEIVFERNQRILILQQEKKEALHESSELRKLLENRNAVVDKLNTETKEKDGRDRITIAKLEAKVIELSKKTVIRRKK